MWGGGWGRVDNRWLHSYSNPLRATPLSHWIYLKIKYSNMILAFDMIRLIFSHGLNRKCGHEYNGIVAIFSSSILVLQNLFPMQLGLSNSLSEKVEWNLIAKLLMAQNYISTQNTMKFSKLHWYINRISMFFPPQFFSPKWNITENLFKSFLDKMMKTFYLQEYLWVADFATQINLDTRSTNCGRLSYIICLR